VTDQAAEQVTDRPGKKTSALREENKRLKVLLRRCAETLNSNFVLIGRVTGEDCPTCCGQLKTSECPRCLRVVRTFGVLDDIDKVLR